MRAGDMEIIQNDGTAGSTGRGWLASLEIGFVHDPDRQRTVLVKRRHVGPLRLLKALDSEDGRRLEAVIVHPPGGLVAGDRLLLDAHAGNGVAVILTTPGAQKWYRSADGVEATMQTRLVLETHAALDWLPQPSILFDGAHAVQTLAIEMAASASVVGWEMLVRGRAAMGEQWRSGAIDQTLAITVDGRPWWQQHLVAPADDRIFGSPLGWRDRRIAASIWACAPSRARADSVALRDAWRERIDVAAAGGAVEGGATAVNDGLVLAQLLGDNVEALQDLAVALWQLARDGASLPRIWRT